MAEHDRRSYRTRDPVAPRNSAASPRAQADDPLAELARLIGQSGPISDREGDDPADSVHRFDDRNADLGPPVRNSAAQNAGLYGGYTAPNGAEQHHSAREAAREPLLASRPPASAPPAPSMNASRDGGRAYAKAHAYRDTAESEVFPSRSADGRYQDDRRYDDDARYEDDSRYQADSRHQEDGRYQHGGSHSDGERDYDYGDDGRDYSDSHAYADDADYAAEHYENETSNGRRRGAFILVATVFVLAVLGTAGAFAYRAIFGGSMLASLPPIIKAEEGPNKIVPTAAGAQGKPSGQADANSADSGEKLVSREEQPVNIQPPANPTAPRIVSTVPVFPDSAPDIGPGSAVTGYPIAPVAAAGPAFGSIPPTNPPGAAAATAAPTPAAAAPVAPGASGPPAANQPVQSAPAAAAPGPAVPPAAKKIHTVAIRSDQSDAADTTSSTQDSQSRGAGPQQHAAKPSPAADANAPLSIVPSGGDNAAPSAVPHSRSAPARPVPLSTAAASASGNEVAAPAPAPAAAGGGYSVQVSSQRSEAEAQDSFRALQAKYPDVLGGRQPIIRKADLGAKGVYYRTLVGPFASAEEATGMCSNLKAAGGTCLVQKN
jgi:hypothetical protein